MDMCVLHAVIWEFPQHFSHTHTSPQSMCKMLVTCIHTYIHTYIHIHGYTHIHTCSPCTKFWSPDMHIHTYLHTHIYKLTCSYIHTYIHACIHTYTHIYIPPVHAHDIGQLTCTNIIHTYIHTYTLTCQYIIHTYIHTRSPFHKILVS
jgi:hypothetical protein